MHRAEVGGLEQGLALCCTQGAFELEGIPENGFGWILVIQGDSRVDVLKRAVGHTP